MEKQYEKYLRTKKEKFIRLSKSKEIQWSLSDEQEAIIEQFILAYESMYNKLLSVKKTNP